MSPTKKKKKTTTRKKPTTKKAPTRKQAPRAAARKAPSAKAVPKAAKAKPASRPAAKTAPAAKAGAAPSAGKAGKKGEAATKPSKAEARRESGKSGESAASKPKGKLVPLSETPHPKYGLKFECYACQTKFYMMGRPEPLCPKCGADQRDRPPEAPKETPKPKRVPLRPMAPLLDDDDEVVAARDDLDGVIPGEPDDMFDDAELEPDADDTELVDPRAAGVGVLDED